MTAPATLPRYAHRRGTRGFAAFVTGLAGFVVLGVGAVVLPTVQIDSIALSWLIPLTVAFGVAHFVAAYGLIRRRAWSARLVGYLAAIGIGIAAYGLILTLTGMDPFGATSKLPSARAWAEGLGLLIWMIGLWLIAARYAFKAFRPVKPNPAAIRPVAAATFGAAA
jgi:ABC-type nickel/cobalt efflux system permease component RcnA